MRALSLDPQARGMSHPPNTEIAKPGFRCAVRIEKSKRCESCRRHSVAPRWLRRASAWHFATAIQQHALAARFPWCSNLSPHKSGVLVTHPALMLYNDITWTCLVCMTRVRTARLVLIHPVKRQKPPRSISQQARSSGQNSSRRGERIARQNCHCIRSRHLPAAQALQA